MDLEKCILVVEATDTLQGVSWPEANLKALRTVSNPGMSQGRGNSEAKRKQSHLGQGERGVRKSLLK